ncbi:MAG: adenylate/guanylate cyclase domain-containing protein [Gaiellaceae bacterium]
MGADRLRGLADRAVGVGFDPHDSLDVRSRKRLLVGVALMVLPAGVIWGALYWGLGERGAALLPWAYTLASVIALVAFARNRSLRFLRTTELALILVTPALLVIALGGLAPSSGVILWSLLAPLGAIVFDSPRRAWAWFIAFLALIAVTIPLARVIRPDAAEMPDDAVLAFAALNIAAVSLVAFTLLVTFARQREAAQLRVETLLTNILPDEIARRLQAEPQAIADHFDAVSILFADVVDFTPMSGRLDAREVVDVLDRLFTSFDEVADRHGVEKIKTIGDCYMVAAGVPIPRDDHAHALVRVALEMRKCAHDCFPAEGEVDLQLRIGISSGPVVAGVIGKRRFLYDLWGDTVNMASRMESHGVPDTIQITRATWELVRDDFATEPLGLVDVKGKGMVETWQLLGPRG